MLRFLEILKKQEIQDSISNKSHYLPKLAFIASDKHLSIEGEFLRMEVRYMTKIRLSLKLDCLTPLCHSYQNGSTPISS